MWEGYARIEQSQPAVSHHLALLRHGGIIDRRRQGKNNFYSLTDTGERLSKIVKDVVAEPAPRSNLNMCTRREPMLIVGWFGFSGFGGSAPPFQQPRAS